MASCLQQSYVTFAPTRRINHGYLLSLKQNHDPDHRTGAASNPLDRRATLATLASIAAFPILSSKAQASMPSPVAKNPLETIQLGEARWECINRYRANEASLSFDASRMTYSADFCTYAARFLIRYDSGVRAWWTALEATSAPKSSSDPAPATLCRSFGSLAKSLQQTFAQESSSNLYDRFTVLYGRQPDATRQIALLFALLPPLTQPTARLEQYYDAVSALAPNNSPLIGSGGGSPLLQTTDEWTRLLSNKFYLIRATDGSFAIEPPVDPVFDTSLLLSGLDATTTPFGPLASIPLTRELPEYSFSTYALFGLAGASGCSLTHTLVIPLDVLKTRAQTDPTILARTGSGSSPNILESGRRIVETEGVGGLLLGTQATIVGYFWYGLSVYPCYTFFKRVLAQTLYPFNGAAAAAQHCNEIALLAGALAAVVASLGLTPMEAARIRAVANPAVYKPLGLVGTMRVIATEDEALGWRNLYAGLPSLLTRQVLFGSIKFLAFERACEFIFAAWPFLLNATWTTLAVSLIAGGWSGVISSIFSQPADSVLTYVTKQGSSGSGSSGKLNLLDGVQQMVANDGPGALFRGLGSRCVWAGCIIAGQFLLYDIFRAVFGVSADDLAQVFEVTLSR